MREQIELTEEQQRQLKQIEERLTIIGKEVDELYEECSFWEELGSEDTQGAEHWYSTHPKVQEQDRLFKHRKLLLPYTLTESRFYNGYQRVPFLVFVDACLAGDFTDNNVIAYYATQDKNSDIRLLPSDILERLYRNDFEYVVYHRR